MSGLTWVQPRDLNAILRELELRGSTSTEAFANRMGGIGMTARRDITDLERRGLLVRAHGGALHLPLHKSRHQDDARSRFASVASITESAAMPKLPPDLASELVDRFAGGGGALPREMGIAMVELSAEYSVARMREHAELTLPASSTLAWASEVSNVSAGRS